MGVKSQIKVTKLALKGYSMTKADLNWRCNVYNSHPEVPLEIGSHKQEIGSHKQKFRSPIRGRGSGTSLPPPLVEFIKKPGSSLLTEFTYTSLSIFDLQKKSRLTHGNVYLFLHSNVLSLLSRPVNLM